MKHRYYFILLFERLFWCSAHIQTSNDIALLCFAASLVNRLASQSWCCCTAKSRPNSSRSCTEVTTTVGWEQTLKSHEEPKVLILRLLQKVHYIATSTHFYPFRFWVAWCRTQWWQCGEYWQAQLEKHLSVLSAACQRISALDALSEQPDTIQSRPIIIGRRSIVHACSQIGIHANFLTYIIYANMCFYGAPQICLLLDQPH